MFRLSTRPAIVSIAMAVMWSALFATERDPILAECAEVRERSVTMDIPLIAHVLMVKCDVRRLDVTADIRSVISAVVRE